MTNNTIRSFAFSVTPRPKPPDYVYTPTERLTFEGLVQKVDDAVADMIRRAESGEFDGHTPVKGTDYFTASEIQQIQNEVSSGAIGEFKSVVDTETDKFNANATEKLNAYNSNANNRVAEFDSHTGQIQTDISELKSDLAELIPSNNVDISQYTVGYITYKGNISTNASCGRVDGIALKKNEKITLNTWFNNTAFSSIYKCNPDGTYTCLVQSVAEQTIYEYTATADITVGVSFYVDKERTCEISLNKISVLDEEIEELKNKVIIYDMFAFNSVGVIGDSMASGCSNYIGSDGNVHAKDRQSFAWGKFLEKETGATVNLFSKGGTDTKTWFTLSTGLPLALENPCECYYIGLGINDYYNYGNDYLGTINDISVGNEDNNGDTYYGNYAKIIGKLKGIQPRCKIFCITMPSTQGENSKPFNTAIRDIVALYDNVYLLDLENDDFYTKEPITSTFFYAHYNAIGYKLMANHILKITNDVIANNISDFSDIQFITENHD